MLAIRNAQRRRGKPARCQTGHAGLVGEPDGRDVFEGAANAKKVSISLARLRQLVPVVGARQHDRLVRDEVAGVEHAAGVLGQQFRQALGHLLGFVNGGMPSAVGQPPEQRQGHQDKAAAQHRHRAARRPGDAPPGMVGRRSRGATRLCRRSPRIMLFQNAALPIERPARKSASYRLRSNTITPSPAVCFWRGPSELAWTKRRCQR